MDFQTQAYGKLKQIVDSETTIGILARSLDQDLEKKDFSQPEKSKTKILEMIG